VRNLLFYKESGQVHSACVHNCTQRRFDLIAVVFGNDILGKPQRGRHDLQGKPHFPAAVADAGPDPVFFIALGDSDFFFVMLYRRQGPEGGRGWGIRDKCKPIA
jgi:hypothetical protein